MTFVNRAKQAIIALILILDHQPSPHTDRFTPFGLTRDVALAMHSLVEKASSNKSIYMQ